MKRTNRLIILQEDDVATTLTNIAEALRNTGMIMAGLAYEGHTPGDPQFRDLMAVNGHLGEKAEVLEHLARGLCQACSTVGIRITLCRGAPPKPRR